MRYRKNLLIGFIAVSLLILLWIWDTKNGRNDNRIIRRNELTQIRGTLSNQPTIETAEQGGPWVPIKLSEFPNFKFDISEQKYHGLKARDFVTDIKIGDTIQISILTYDYDTKIKKKKSLRISEEFINYNFIEPYELIFQDREYMTLENTNNAWQDNKSLDWIMYILIGTIVITIIFTITGHLKLKEDNPFENKL